VGRAYLLRVKKPLPVHVVPGAIRLDAWICSELSSITYAPGKGHADGNFVAKLACGQTDRYAELDEILKRIGGRWDRRAGGHVFTFDPAEVIAAVAESGRMPAKNPLDFFPTPRVVIDEIFKDEEINDHLNFIAAYTDHRILEPSAGTGAFVKYLLEKFPEMKGRIDSVEPDPIKCAALRKLGAGEVYEAAFEQWTPTAVYGAIIMNPPFSLPGDKKAFATHITKAYGLLKEENSLLVAIAPTSFLDQDKFVDFRNMVAEQGSFLLQERGEFKESGTMVETATVTLWKTSTNWRHAPHDGYANFWSFNLGVFADNTPEFHQNLLEIGAAILDGQPEVVDMVDRLMSRAGDALWKESQFLIPSLPGIVEGIRADLMDSARAMAEDSMRYAGGGSTPAMTSKAKKQKVADRVEGPASFDAELKQDCLALF
jgi:hypothetical protein